MINSFSMSNMEWTKSYFSLGHDNSQQCSPLSFMWYQSHLETCDLSCVIERAGNLPCLC